MEPSRIERLTEQVAAWSSNPRNIEELRESCPFHVALHGTMGFGFGAMLGMFMASMSAGGTSPEARLLSGAATDGIAALPMRMQVKMAMGDLVKRSWSSAKNFGLIAAIYSGSECVIEGVTKGNEVYTVIYYGFSVVSG